MSGSISADKLEQVIYDYAWHLVNTSAGNKTAAYSKAFGEEKSRTAASSFYKRHKKEIDVLMDEFRAENRAEYPHIRENNIAVLTNIIASSSKDTDRISAIKTLNDMCGFNTQNLNVNGKVDSDIEVVITGI